MSGKGIKKYGVIYAQAVFPDGHKLEGLNHCYIESEDLRLVWLRDELREFYGDKIIIDTDLKVNLGCLTVSDCVSSVAYDIHDKLVKIVGDNFIRVVYAVLDFCESDVLGAGSVHRIGTVSSKENYNKMSHFGRSLLTKEAGVYEF